MVASGATGATATCPTNMADLTKIQWADSTCNPAMSSTPTALASLSPAQVLPTPWQDFCEAHQREFGMPADMVAVCLVGAMAGFAAGHVTGDLGRRRVLPNLFILMAAPPGGNKTECHVRVTGPLLELQRAAVAAARKDWETKTRVEILACEARIAEARRELREASHDRSIAERIASLEAARRNTRMYSRVPSPSRSSSSRRLSTAKHSGSTQPCSGRAWSSAPGLRSSSAR